MRRWIHKVYQELFLPKYSRSIWFGGQQVRSLPRTQPLVYTTGMAYGVVWAKLIQFELQRQIQKNYNGAHIKSKNEVMLKY